MDDTFGRLQRAWKIVRIFWYRPSDSWISSYRKSGRTDAERLRRGADGTAERCRGNRRATAAVSFGVGTRHDPSTELTLYRYVRQAKTYRNVSARAFTNCATSRCLNGFSWSDSSRVYRSHSLCVFGLRFYPYGLIRFMPNRSTKQKWKSSCFTNSTLPGLLFGSMLCRMVPTGLWSINLDCGNPLSSMVSGIQRNFTKSLFGRHA